MRVVVERTAEGLHGITRATRWRQLCVQCQHRCRGRHRKSAAAASRYRASWACTTCDCSLVSLALLALLFQGPHRSPQLRALTEVLGLCSSQATHDSNGHCSQAPAVQGTHPDASRGPCQVVFTGAAGEHLASALLEPGTSRCGASCHVAPGIVAAADMLLVRAGMIISFSKCVCPSCCCV